MYEEWVDEPPADVFVSAYFGYKKPSRPTEVNALQMALDFPSGIIGLNN
jgi:hypothetical protein